MLYLEPSAAARAGRVRARERLRHHTFVSGGDRVGVKFLGAGEIRFYDALDYFQPGRRLQLFEHGNSLGPWAIDRQVAVEREHVEYVKFQRLLSASLVDVARASKAAHEILKCGRPPRRVHADHLTVEDRVTRADSIHRLDHIGD